MIIVLFIIGFILGWFLREAYAKRQLKYLLSSLEIDQNETRDSEPLSLTFTQYREIIYVHEGSNYLTQGENMEEIIKKLKDIIPGRAFYVNKVERLDEHERMED